MCFLFSLSHFEKIKVIMKLNAVKCNCQFQTRRMTMSEQLIKKWHKGLVSASKQSETGRNVWLLFF